MNAPAPTVEKNTGLSTVFNGAPDAAGDATDHVADGSRRAQKLQDQLAAAANAAPENAPRKGDPRDDRAVSQWYSEKAGKGIYQSDDEISIYIDRRKGLTPRQIEDTVKAAISKGWKEIYIYDAKGKPDLRMAAMINDTIAKMGVGDRIHCCTDPQELCTHIDEMKKVARGLATATAAGALAAAAVAAAQQMAPA
jgi:hypothetical protein